MRLLIFFPEILPDELLYSVFARYHRNSGNESSRQTMKDLFENPSTCSSIWFPSQLDHLTRQIRGQAYTSEDLIQKHTLLPYFTPFIPCERVSRLMETIKGNVSSPANMILGRTASTVKPKKFLMYCPDCVNDDREKYGEAYWHRVHQIEGVCLCPNHGFLLVQSGVSHQNKKNRYHYITLEKALLGASKSTVLFDLLEDEHLQFVAVQSRILLEEHLPSPGLQRINQYYVSKLLSKGYVCLASNRIRWDKLIPAFRGHYREEMLVNFNGLVTINNEASWLHKLLRKPRVTCHPLRHILLLGFLGETINSMFEHIDEGKVSFEPFGPGPWPCLNKVAEHYKQEVIHCCTITRCSKTGLPIGTFVCSCGFVYSRKGPDKEKNDRFKIGRTKGFGHVWEIKFEEVSQTNLSLRKKAQILGCDPQTVLNYYKKLQKR
ncbi:TnsD family Tn7-like transposition protein [Paenibacillus ottowii]